MNPIHQPLQSILQHLFQATSLEEVSRQRLESFVEEHPSFGIGHYLLSHKLLTEDPVRFEEATQRTCLYFSNPFWLQWQLENGAAASGPTRVAALPANGPERMETRGAEMPAEPEIETIDTALEEPVTETPESQPIESEAPAGESAADELLRNLEEAKGIRESLQHLSVEDGNGRAQPDDPIHDEETPFVLDETEEPGPQQPVPEPTPAVFASAAEGQQPGHEPTPQHAPQPTPAPASPTPAAPDLVFEPYHTIDYFASQGIRLTMDDNPADALGKQLKSFTDWLKVMRRLPQKDRESAVPDRVAEQAVQTFAAHSIQSKDVLTETMAEVLIKQGMHDRAKAIYEKLLFLNPDKKAYFAAKIEQLNIP